MSATNEAMQARRQRREQHNYRSLLYKLPNELLSLICQFHVWSDDGAFAHSRPLDLSHVSQRLRQVAHADPSLWRTISFPLTHAVHGFAQDQLFLQLARDQDLFVDIDWTTREEGFQAEEIDDWEMFPVRKSLVVRAARILAQYMHRVRRFHFSCQAYRPINAFFTELEHTPAPLLERLELARNVMPVNNEYFVPPEYQFGPMLFAGVLPMLRHVHVEGMHFRWKDLRLNDVKVLVLRNHARLVRPSIAWLGKTIASSPLIEQLEINDSGCNSNAPALLPECVLPALTKAKFSNVPGDFLDSFLRCIRAPNIETLAVCNLTLANVRSLLVAFREVIDLRIAHCLEGLLNSQPLMHVFEGLTRLTRLELNHCPIAPDLLRRISARDEELAIEVRKTRRQSYTGPGVFLPYLRELYLSRGLETDVDDVVRFARNRLARGVPLDRIEYCEWVEPEYDEEEETTWAARDTAVVTLDGRTCEELKRIDLVADEDALMWLDDDYDEYDDDAVGIDELPPLIPRAAVGILDDEDLLMSDEDESSEEDDFDSEEDMDSEEDTDSDGDILLPDVPQQVKVVGTLQHSAYVPAPSIPSYHVVLPPHSYFNSPFPLNMFSSPQPRPVVPDALKPLMRFPLLNHNSMYQYARQRLTTPSPMPSTISPLWPLPTIA